MGKRKVCQSCGMPLAEDLSNAGTNLDGSKNDKYCMYCYKDGELACKEMNVSEFQEFCRKEMIKGGHDKFKSWLFTRCMSRLERWKK